MWEEICRVKDGCYQWEGNKRGEGENNWSTLHMCNSQRTNFIKEKINKAKTTLYFKFALFYYDFPSF